jgi:hypothetical protein
LSETSPEPGMSRGTDCFPRGAVFRTEEVTVQSSMFFSKVGGGSALSSHLLRRKAGHMREKGTFLRPN